MAEHDLAPFPKKPHLKKIRTTGLNATAPRGGRPPAPRHHRRPCSSCPAPMVKPTGRGIPTATHVLTVRIFETDLSGNGMSMKSAPVRTLRRLPAIPVPPAPRSAAPVPGPSSLIPPTQFFARSRGGSTRVIRPLPCPPFSSKGSAHTTTTPRSTTTTPTERPRARVIRPLPIPVPQLKVEPLVLTRPVRAAACPPPCSLPQSVSTLTSPLPPPSTIPVSHSHSDTKTRDDDDQKTNDCLLDFGRDADEEEKPATVHSRNRVSVLVWKGPRHHRSLDSLCSASEDEELGFSNLVVRNVTRTEERKLVQQDEEDTSQFVDYAWMLSNRVLYRQGDKNGNGDPQFNSKWVREKKGKRFTEDDYDKVLHVLRML